MNDLKYCLCEDGINISAATFSYISLLQLKRIQYQKKHTKYSVIWMKCPIQHRRVFLDQSIFHLV